MAYSPNIGLNNMLSILGNNADNFKKDIFDQLIQKDRKDPRCAKVNRLVIRKMLSSNLRRDIMNSSQLKNDESRLIYLNTLKCTVLRCVNGSLTSRLQMGSTEKTDIL
jgi:hypothetical protein